jgi:uncharacterized lipoprotein YmbA
VACIGSRLQPIGDTQCLNLGALEPALGLADNDRRKHCQVSLIMGLHRYFLLSLLVLGLPACSLQAPAPLYQLDAGKLSAPSARSSLVLLLQPVMLAQYLQRDVLLQRQADGSLLETQAHWAGSLPEDVEQLLVRQLASRLQTQNVHTAANSASLVADLQLQVSIDRLDSGPQQPAILHAQWRLLDKNGQLREQRLLQLEQAHAVSLASQVQAQSLLLQRLSEQLALAVNQFNASAASGPTNRLPPVPRKPALLPPKTAAPSGPAEVYRF